jgi:glutathione S-transferase
VIRLFGIPMSHPVLAAQAMLERKDLRYRYFDLLAGAHPPSLLALGFRGVTVPAMKLPDGGRVQGSLAIARALEQAVPTPSLYPREPAARAAAEDAERWGERVLQPVPRRLIRWGLSRDPRQRRWFADVATPLPAPALAAVVMSSLAPLFARQADVSNQRVRRDLAELPALLDEVDRLVACGVIGGSELGAADFQIAASIRTLMAIDDVAELVAGRPAEALGLRAIPSVTRVPPVLPEDWLPTR